MRNTIAAAAAVAAIAFTLIFSPMAAPPARAAVDVSFDFFYNDLSPHGSWLVSGSYGRVWQPAVYRPGWNPYYDGHWQYSDVGWVWLSDYDWGAVPYHYGTWVQDPDYDWVWVPGYTWAPAWVVFRQGPQAVGWAPVSPEFSIGISFGSRSYYEPPPSAFVFVPVRQFAAPRIRPYVVPERRVNAYIQNTTIINNNLTVQNNIVVNRGPDVRVVERAAGRTIQPQPVERVVQRVAPFQGFTRQQMAVPMDRGGQRVARAAVPQTGGLSQNQYNRIHEQNRQRLEGLQRERQQRPEPQPQQNDPRRQQQLKEQQAQEQIQKERQVLPQPTPPDEPRPLPPPRPNPPRPPVPQPPPHLEPDHQAQPQGQGQPQGQQPNKKKNNNKKKPAQDKKDQEPQKDQGNG